MSYCNSRTQPDHQEVEELNPISNANSFNSHIDNPYDKKPSYKDVLLSKVTDDSNRMGINTFQLIHLLNNSAKAREETARPRTPTGKEHSERSDGTEAQSNYVELRYHRMRLQFTLEDTSPETYIEDVMLHLNKILEILNLNTPGVSLAPWHKKKEIKREELLKELSDDALEAVRYLYGFKAGMTKNKSQYLRIHIAFPSFYTAEDSQKK